RFGTVKAHRILVLLSRVRQLCGMRCARMSCAGRVGFQERDRSAGDGAAGKAIRTMLQPGFEPAALQGESFRVRDADLTPLSIESERQGRARVQLLPSCQEPRRESGGRTKLGKVGRGERDVRLRPPAT